MHNSQVKYATYRSYERSLLLDYLDNGKENV